MSLVLVNCYASKAKSRFLFCFHAFFLLLATHLGLFLSVSEGFSQEKRVPAPEKQVEHQLTPKGTTVSKMENTPVSKIENTPVSKTVTTPESKTVTTPESKTVTTPVTIDLKTHIKEVSSGHFEITYDVFVKEMEQITRQIRIIPHFVHGQPSGFKLSYIKPNSILFYLGYKSGDIFKAVAGEDLLDINQSLALYEQSIKARLIKISIEREGQRLSFEYKLK